MTTNPITRRRLIAAGAGAAAIAPALAIDQAGGTPARAASPMGGPLVTLALPTRIYDSRSPNTILGGNRLKSGQGLLVAVTTGLPEPAASVLMNCTVTQTIGSGWLTIIAFKLPHGSPAPETSNVNWTADDQTVANLVLAPVGDLNGVETICGGSGETHFIFDLLGYVPAPAL